jgi:RNA polymerase sigma-70 factor (ECF subfamily)
MADGGLRNRASVFDAKGARRIRNPQSPIRNKTVPDDLAEVYRTTYRALVRFLYRKVWDAERAEDLAQEAFARALVHKPENARGWLFVVAANMARDEARRAMRERRHLTLLSNEAADPGPPPDAALVAEQERERVRSALDRLTPRDREVLLLWDSGLSYDEIAGQTGLAQGAIGTTLARARRRLVEAYETGSEDEHVARG